MVDIYEYINIDTIENKNSYELIKDSITCHICTEIMIRPVMCMNCQHAYCKRCIEHWNNNKNYCPNKCPNPIYRYSVLVGNLLSSLEIRCKDCGILIHYDNMEKHVLSKCDTIEIKYPIKKESNSDGIFKKIPTKELDEIKFYEQPKMSMKSKTLLFNIKYFSFFHIVMCLGASQVGKTSLINT